jgi:hypothetical protein
VIRKWCIPPQHDASFVAAMEAVLDVYAHPPDPTHPVVCFDECCKELHQAVRPSLHDRHGERVDPDYARQGMAPLHVWIEPHTGRMGVQVTQRRTNREFAEAIAQLVAAYPHAEQITVVLDNLNTHRIAALYAAFPAPEAARLRRRVRLVHTPIHASWLNMAEIAISVLSRAVMKDQRFATRAALEAAVTTWVAAHNTDPQPITWRFDVDRARAIMPRVYPVVELVK